MPQAQGMLMLWAQEVPMSQAQDGSGDVVGTDDVPLGANGVEADGANPRLGNDVGGLCHNLVVCGDMGLG
jgi:hypothetical protein